MRRAYLDCEFTTLNPFTHQLISLALVVPCGPSFYVEINDTWTAEDCSDFVLEVVLPQLDLDTHGRSTDVAGDELQAFLRELGPVEIFSDAPQWDWPLLRWLAGPSGIPATTTKGHIDAERLPCIEIEAPHHALEDARQLAELCEHAYVISQ